MIWNEKLDYQNILDNHQHQCVYIFEALIRNNPKLITFVNSMKIQPTWNYFLLKDKTVIIAQSTSNYNLLSIDNEL